MKTSEKSVASAVASIFTESDHTDLKTFFVNELKDIYWAENHLVKAIGKMSKAATSDNLKRAFDTHLKQTEVHVERLNQIFEALGEKAEAKKCEAMDGIIKEGNTIVEDTTKGTMVRDAGLIFAAQKVEHYEIATYGSLKAVANILKLKKTVVSLLDKTLSEEKQTDELLTELAESFVNPSALEEK